MVCFTMGGHIHYVFLCVLLSFITTRQGWCGSPEKEIVELDDMIPEKNQFLSKRTGYVGDSIVIGSHHELYNPNAEYFDKYPTGFSSVYKCILSTEASDYQPAFETEVSNGEEKKEASYYFYYIAKEMWTCSDERGEPEKQNFYRIKNVLISTKEIYEIKYIPETRVARINYSQNGRRVRVEEIKYYKKNKDNTYEQVSAVKERQKKMKYYLFHDENQKSPIPSLSGAFPLLDDFKESMSLDISASGNSFKIGSTWKGNEKYDEFRRDLRNKLRCNWHYEINPELFRPEVFRVHTLKEKLEIYGKISDKEFEESFILVERTLWHCYHYDIAAIQKETKFLLVKQEVVGKKPVAKLLYEKGISSVSTITIPGGTSIRYTEVSLFRYDNLQRFDIDLGVELGRVIDFYGPPIIYTIGEHRKLEYSLGYNEVFRTLISDNGLDLRVGSDKKKIMFKECYIATCRKSNEYLDEYRTEIMVLMNKDDKLYKTQVITNDHEKKYYEYTSQEVWSCKCGVSPVKPSFMRIINKLRMLVPIREIETFDGVELIHGTSDTLAKHTLGIIETKYYDPITGKSLNKFKTIHLDYDPPASTPAASDLNDGPHWTNYIQKEKDEVVNWIDQTTDEDFHLKDCVENDCSTKNTLMVGQGRKALQFSYYGKEENEEPLYICVSNPDFSDKYFRRPDKLTATFKILEEGSQEVDTISDKSRSSQYFDAPKIEYWTCKWQKTAADEDKLKRRSSFAKKFRTSQSKKNANELIRVVYRQSLKKTILDDVGKIEYFKKNDKVWIDSIGDQYEVKTENIRYYTGSGLELSDLNNRLLLHEQILPAGPWKSGTELILDDDKPKTSHEISYTLNATARYYHGPYNEKGAEILVGSLEVIPIKVIPDKDVKCKKVLNRAVNIAYATRVIRDPRNIAEKYNSPYQDQDVWKCMRDGENIFNLVRNRISFIQIGISNINCSGEIKVGTNDLPGMKSNIDITELKFVEPLAGSAIKYDGPVFLEADDDEQDSIFVPEIIKRLYPMPWTKKPPIYIAKAYVEEVRKLERMQTKQAKPMQAVTYLMESHVHISTLSGTFPLVYKIEVNFDENFQTSKKNSRARMLCLLDRWTKNKLSHLRYIPKVVQYVGDKSYEFDENEIFGKFFIKSKLWFCTYNDEVKIFKVEVRMTPRTSMYILYSGSVTIESSDETSTIVINAYIDQTTFKVYKYDKTFFEFYELR